MEILEKNLNLLSKKNRTLALNIKNHTEFSSSFVLDEALSGDYILKKNDVFLHSNIDPEQEAIDLLNKIEYKHSNSFNFIYGLGLGYLLKRFNKKIDGYIIVYETDLDVLRLAFEMVDFSDELSNERVFIFNNFDDLNDFYKKHFFYDYQISTSICQTYKDNDLANAQKFIKDLGYLHGLYLSNFKTYWNKYQRWIGALVENMDCISNYEEVKSLTNIYENKPAIVISAGPSLNKNIDIIAKYQNNFIIYCVGTALKAVLEKGIKPDFVCFIESIPVTAKMLEDKEIADYNFIIQPTTNKSVLEKKAKGKYIFYADNDEPSKYLAKKFSININGYINRGTVSINALVSAKIMGCNPIVLVGQDLAYTNNECYAKGSIYDSYKLEGDKVITTNFEELMKKTAQTKEVIDYRLYMLTSQLYKVKGQNGETLYSPGDYASFIKHFEEIALEYQKTTKLINSTEGGAQIDGYENKKLIDTIKEFASTPLNKEFNQTMNKTTLRKNILKNEINICLKEWNSFYKNNFEKGYNIASKMDIDYNCATNADIYTNELKQLLVLYKELCLHNKSDLFNIFIGRNVFFINKYLENFHREKDKNNLINNLHLFYKTDYELYIKPYINKLTEEFVNYAK